MFVVALAKLAGTLDAELPHLASDLGQTPYEARMMLTGGMPSIVLLTPDKHAAITLLGRLKAREHHAVAIDSSAVVSGETLKQIRKFHFDSDSLILDDDLQESIPYDDILVLLRASHESRVTNSIEEKSKQFSAGRAILSGGLVLTKNSTKSKDVHSEERQDVLYIFRNGGAHPVLLNASVARYTGLGQRMATTERANFLTTVEMIRERTPHAYYDERLVTRKVPDRISQFVVQGISSSSRVVSSNNVGVDLFAHLLALCLVKQIL
jgi:hypothetical protein